MFVQAGGAPASTESSARQHLTGFASPASAMRPKSLWWSGAWAAKLGITSAQVPHHCLQVRTTNISMAHTIMSFERSLISFFLCLLCTGAFVCLQLRVAHKEPIQCGGDRHLLLHQPHHCHDNTLHPAGQAHLPYYALSLSLSFFLSSFLGHKK